MQDNLFQYALLRAGGKRKRVTQASDAALTRIDPLKNLSQNKAQRKKQKSAKKAASHYVKKNPADYIVLSDSEDGEVHPASLLSREPIGQTHTFANTIAGNPALHMPSTMTFPDNRSGLPLKHQNTVKNNAFISSGHPRIPIAYTPDMVVRGTGVYTGNPEIEYIHTDGTIAAPLPLGTSTIATPSISSITSETVGAIEPEPVLCKEQSDLVNLICSGRNVFYTGSAGCGKSTVLKAFVKRMRSESKSPKNIHIIAPTGRAALDIGGSTFWTYAGWTPDHMKKPIGELRKMAHGKFVNKRLRETDVLVIDEISMMENHHFERLNIVMKAARTHPNQTPLPFGGVQLIVTGDFCQLPPVKPFQYCITCGKELVVSVDGKKYNCKTGLNRDPDGTTYPCVEHGEFLETNKWAFRSAAWEECNFHHVNLTTIHRQSDREFIDILQNVRLGRRLTFTETDKLLHHDSSIHNAVRLFSTREEVRKINEAEFKRLRSRESQFHCLDDFRHHLEHKHLAFKGNRNQFDNSLDALRDHRYEKLVTLKQGMLVVLQLNLDMAAGLVNGSQGVIVSWEDYDPKKLPKAPQHSELSKKGRMGATETAYGAPILGGEHAMVREDNIKRFAEAAADKRWPIVLFQNGVKRTIYAHCGLSELGDYAPFSLLSRTQIPLLAAWAMSVHKAQGMTLNRVIVDLSRAFEEGQVYVALSRARSLEGLKVEALGSLGTEGGNAQVREFLRRKFGFG